MSVLTNQLKSLLLSFVLIVAISGIVLGTVIYFHYSKNITFKFLTNDPAVVAELPAYVGVLSQLGIFLWASTAAICLFCTRLIKNKAHRTFIFSSALITILLGFDDAFMFHEIVFPSLGVQQKIVFLSYIIIMLLYGLKFIKVLFKSDYLLLLFSVFWFGVSLIVDNFFANSSPYIAQLLEDGAKFIGIVSWLFYFARTCRQILIREGLKST
nr:hypothetical protein [uncultured Psychroserpens sp.]